MSGSSSAYNGFLDRFTELTAFGLEHMVEEGRIEPLRLRGRSRGR